MSRLLPHQSKQCRSQPYFLKQRPRNIQRLGSLDQRPQKRIHHLSRVGEKIKTNQNQTKPAILLYVLEPHQQSKVVYRPENPFNRVSQK